MYRETCLVSLSYAVYSTPTNHSIIHAPRVEHTRSLGGVESPTIPSFLPRTSTREPEKHGVSSAIALWFPRAHAGGGRTVQRSSPSVQSPGFTPTPPEHTLIPTRKPESQEIGSDSCCRLMGGWTFAHAVL